VPEKSKVVRNEQLKLTATAINNLAVAFVVTGFIIPVAALAYQAAFPKTRYWAGFAILWIVAAVVLHYVARRVLEGVKE
jgi:hypothetical protein